MFKRVLIRAGFVLLVILVFAAIVYLEAFVLAAAGYPG